MGHQTCVYEKYYLNFKSGCKIACRWYGKNNKFQSGKTAIANFLSESINVEEVNSARPTQGVRIVEFALSHLNINEKQCKVDIEMWDCSGDHRYILLPINL